VDVLSRRTEVDLRPLRWGAVALIPAAVVLSVLPFSPIPPCPLRSITGVPCPLCGSTRGVIAAVHGHVGQALTLNPASLLVIALAVALLVTWRFRPAERLRIPIWVVPAALGALWCYQLFKYATGRPL